MSNNPILEFQSFRKLARLSRPVIITEKLDGTNAQVVIQPIVEMEQFAEGEAIPKGLFTSGEYCLRAGSRNRWISLTDDNYGFAKWVHDNAEELTRLGPGRHFGEYWGAGIQRNYGLVEKRFSLFNTEKWSDPAVRPPCCHVVPVLETGDFNTDIIDRALFRLREYGSVAALGFMKPEGIVIYHAASGQLFKKTIEHDEQHKSQIQPI